MRNYVLSNCWQFIFFYILTLTTIIKVRKVITSFIDELIKASRISETCLVSQWWSLVSRQSNLTLKNCISLSTRHIFILDFHLLSLRIITEAPRMILLTFQIQLCESLMVEGLFFMTLIDSFSWPKVVCLKNQNKI